MFNQTGQGYGYPQQQNVNLPFSATEMQTAIMQLAYGQPPVNMQLQCPQELQQYTPLILNQLAVALQERATANKLRLFIYNQMAVNNFNNQDFYKLANMACECVDLAMRTQQNASIEIVIQKAARNVVQFVTALNATLFPGLTINLPAADMQQIQNAIGEFNNEVQGMKQMLLPQQPQGGWSSNNNSGGWQPQSNNWVPQQPRQPYGGSHQAAGHGYGGLSTGRPVEAAPAASWRGRTVGAVAMKPTTQIVPEVTTIGSSRKSFRAGYIPPADASAKPAVRSVDPTVNPQPPAPIVPKTDIEVYDDSGFTWLTTQGYTASYDWRSTKLYPFTVAYNPTRFKLNHLSDPQGNIRPVLVTKEPLPMDRVEHLTAPKIAPTWTLPVYSESTAMDRFDRNIALVPEDLVYVDYPGPISQSASSDEHWVMGSAYLGAVLINRENFRQVVRLKGIVTDPAVCNAHFKMEIEDLVKLTAPGTVHSRLNKILVEASERSERHDIQLVNRINKLLTMRINRFVRNELALTSGTIESFLTDAPALAPYLEKKFGEAAKEAFLSAFPDMVVSTLAYYKGNAHEDVVDYYCSGFMKELKGPADNRDLMTFFQYNEYAIVDLSSIELQVDLGSTKVAVGVKQSLTPLFYGICETLLGEYDHSAVKTNTRYYIRTNDGVTFEINRGAINKEFFLASLVN